MYRGKKQKYGLRKLSVGVVSCLLGSALYFGVGMNVYAQETTMPEGKEPVVLEDVDAQSVEPVPVEQDNTMLEVQEDPNEDEGFVVREVKSSDLPEEFDEEWTENIINGPGEYGVYYSLNYEIQPRNEDYERRDSYSISEAAKYGEDGMEKSEEDRPNEEIDEKVNRVLDFGYCGKDDYWMKDKISTLIQEGQGVWAAYQNADQSVIDDLFYIATQRAIWHFTDGPGDGIGFLSGYEKNDSISIIEQLLLNMVFDPEVRPYPMNGFFDYFEKNVGTVNMLPYLVNPTYIGMPYGDFGYNKYQISFDGAPVKTLDEIELVVPAEGVSKTVSATVYYYNVYSGFKGHQAPWDTVVMSISETPGAIDDSFYYLMGREFESLGTEGALKSRYFMAKGRDGQVDIAIKDFHFEPNKIYYVTVAGPYGNNYYQQWEDINGGEGGFMSNPFFTIQTFLEETENNEQEKQPEQSSVVEKPKDTKPQITEPKPEGKEIVDKGTKESPKPSKVEKVAPTKVKEEVQKDKEMKEESIRPRSQAVSSQSGVVQTGVEYSEAILSTLSMVSLFGLGFLKKKVK